MPTKHGVARSNRAGRANIESLIHRMGLFLWDLERQATPHPLSLTGIDASHQSQYLNDVVMLGTF